MCTSVHLSVSALRVFSYPLRIKWMRARPLVDHVWADIPPVADAKPMTSRKHPDLASQLGDLALDTRVQLRDLTSRPELNGR